MTRVRIHDPFGKIGPSQICLVCVPRNPHGCCRQFDGIGTAWGGPGKATGGGDHQCADRHRGQS